MVRSKGKHIRLRAKPKAAKRSRGVYKRSFYLIPSFKFEHLHNILVETRTGTFIAANIAHRCRLRNPSAGNGEDSRQKA